MAEVDIDAIIATVSLNTKVAEQQLLSLSKQGEKVGKSLGNLIGDGISKGVSQSVGKIVSEIKKNEALRNLSIKINLEPVITKKSIQEALSKVKDSKDLGKINIPIDFKNFKSALKNIQREVDNLDTIKLKVSFEKDNVSKVIGDFKKSSFSGLGLLSNPGNKGSFIQSLPKELAALLKKSGIVGTEPLRPNNNRSQQEIDSIVKEAQRLLEASKKIEESRTKISEKAKEFKQKLDEANAVFNTKRDNSFFDEESKKAKPLIDDLTKVNSLIKEYTQLLVKSGVSGNPLSFGKSGFKTTPGLVEDIRSLRDRQSNLTSIIGDSSFKEALEAEKEFSASILKVLNIFSQIDGEILSIDRHIQKLTKEINNLGEEDKEQIKTKREQIALLREEADLIKATATDSDRVRTRLAGKINAQSFIAESVRSGQTSQLSGDLLALATKGKSFSEVLAEESAQVRKALIEEKRVILSRAQASKLGLAVELLSEEDRKIIDAQLESEVKTRRFMNELAKREKDLKQRTINKLAQLLDEQSQDPKRAGFLASAGQLNLSKNPFLRVEQDGSQIPTVSPEETKRIEALSSQWEKAKKQIEEVRAASAAFADTRTAHIKIIDKETGAILVNEKAVFRYGQQLANIENLEIRSAAFTQNLGNQLLTAAHKVAQWTVATGILFATARAIRELISVSTEMNKKMVEMQSILNPTTTDFEELQRSAFDLSIKFGKSISDTTDIMINFAKQGFDVNEVLLATNAALLLTNVSALNGAESAKQLTTVMKQLGVTASDILPKIDALVAVADSFAVEVDDLTKGVSRTGSAAQNIGVNFNDLVAIIATVGEATQRTGAEIGTAFRTIFASAVGSESIKMFKSLGIEIVGTNGDIKSFTDVLAELSGKWSNLTDIQKVNVAQVLGGKRRYNEVLALLDNYDRFLEASTIATNSLNNAQDKNRKIMESYAKTIEVTKSEMERFFVTIGENGGIDVLNTLNSGLQKSLSLFASLSDASGGIVGAGLFGATALPALVGGGSFLANTLGILPPATPTRSTVERVQFSDFILAFREIIEEQTKSINANQNKNADEIAASNRARAGIDAAVNGNIVEGIAKGAGKRATISQTFKETQGFFPAIAAAGGVGIRNVGSSIASGIKGVIAGGLQIIAITAVIAAVGAALSILLKIFKKATRTSEEYVKEEAARVELLKNQRLAIEEAVQRTSGIKVIGGVAQVSGAGTNNGSLNNLAVQFASIKGLTKDIKTIVDDNGNVTFDFGISKFNKESQGATKVISDINLLLKRIKNESKSLELSIITSAFKEFGQSKSIAISGLNEIQVKSKDVGKFIEEVLSNRIGSKKFKESSLSIQSDIGLIKNAIASLTKDESLIESIIDPATGSDVLDLLSKLGERTATLGFQFGNLKTEQDKVKYGFNQYIASVLSSRGAAIQANNGIFDSESIEKYANTLLKVERSSDGTTRTKASNEVAFANGRLVDSVNSVLEAELASSEVLRSRIRPGMVGLVKDTKDASYSFITFTKDALNNTIAIDSTGKQIKLTDSLMRDLVVTTKILSVENQGLGKDLESINRDFNRMDESLNSINKTISALNRISDVSSIGIDLSEKLQGGITGSLSEDKLKSIFTLITQLENKIGANSGVNIRQEAEQAARSFEGIVSNGYDTLRQSLVKLKEEAKNGVTPNFDKLFEDTAKSLQASSVTLDLITSSATGTPAYEKYKEIAEKSIRFQFTALMSQVLSVVKETSKSINTELGSTTIGQALSGLELNSGLSKETTNKIRDYGQKLFGKDFQSFAINQLLSSITNESEVTELLSDSSKLTEKLQEESNKQTQILEKGRDQVIEQFSIYTTEVEKASSEITKLFSERFSDISLFDNVDNIQIANRYISEMVDHLIKVGQLDLASQFVKISKNSFDVLKSFREISSTIRDIFTQSGTSQINQATEIFEQTIGELRKFVSKSGSDAANILKKRGVSDIDTFNVLSTGKVPESIKSKLVGDEFNILSADLKALKDGMERLSIIQSANTDELLNISSERLAGLKPEERALASRGFNQITNLIGQLRSSENMSSSDIENTINRALNNPSSAIQSVPDFQAVLDSLKKESQAKIDPQSQERIIDALVKASEAQKVIENATIRAEGILNITANEIKIQNAKEETLNNKQDTTQKQIDSIESTVKKPSEIIQDVLKEISASTNLQKISAEEFVNIISKLNIDEKTKNKILENKDSLSQLDIIKDLGVKFKELLNPIDKLKSILDGSSESLSNYGAAISGASNSIDNIKSSGESISKFINDSIVPSFSNLLKSVDNNASLSEEEKNVTKQSIQAKLSEITSLSTLFENLSVDNRDKAQATVDSLFKFFNTLNIKDRFGDSGLTGELIKNIVSQSVNTRKDVTIENNTKVTAELNGNISNLVVNTKSLDDSIRNLTTQAGVRDVVSQINVTPDIPRNHTGAIYRSGLANDEFTAILQRGEAVIPRNLVSKIPGEIISQLPRFHTGALFPNSNQFSNLSFPTEIEQSFVELIAEIRKIGERIELKNESTDTLYIKDNLNIQNELMINMLAELKNINSTKYSPDADFGRTLTESIAEAIIKPIGSLVSSIAGQGSRKQENIKSEIFVTLSKDSAIKHKVDLENISPDIINRAVADYLRSNPDLLTSLITSTPVVS